MTSHISSLIVKILKPSGKHGVYGGKNWLILISENVKTLLNVYCLGSLATQTTEFIILIKTLLYMLILEVQSMFLTEPKIQSY